MESPINVKIVNLIDNSIQIFDSQTNADPDTETLAKNCTQVRKCFPDGCHNTTKDEWNRYKQRDRQNARDSLTSIHINKLVKKSEPKTDGLRTVPGSAQDTIFCPEKKSQVNIPCHCPFNDYSQIMVVGSRKGAAGLVAFPHNQLLTLKLTKKKYQRNSQDSLKKFALVHIVR